jgi:hypothetical protein
LPVRQAWHAQHVSVCCLLAPIALFTPTTLLGPTAPAAPAGNNSQDGAASTFAGAAVGQV